MINFIIEGHTLENEVQTIIQVFYPNEHYYCVNEVSENTVTIKSILEKNLSIACIYKNGKFLSKYEIAYIQDDIVEKKDLKRLVKTTIYRLLKDFTSYKPSWGLLTGVRPAKAINELINIGYSEKECVNYLIEKYDVDEDKCNLAVDVALFERKILSKSKQDDISIYIGIPFCPSRCIYCSFTSYPLEKYKTKVDTYIDCLIKELNILKEYSKNKTIKSIYIGGGTPTSLNEEQLKKLMYSIENIFDISNLSEYTVEAGRPDTITKDKLKIMKDYNSTRISINPQTMNQKTLDLIGRKHSIKDIKNIYNLAREFEFNNINMDLILGLPGEDEFDVENTMKEIEKLYPDNLTVHTLAVKRASRLREEFDLNQLTNIKNMEKMLEISSKYAYKMNMKPYYMYRQKNMIGSFENVGYCIEGKESLYNIMIMEEKQTILAAGAGASTKTIDFKTNRIERIFNVKDVDEYITRIDEMIDRKKKGLTKE